MAEDTTQTDTKGPAEQSPKQVEPVGQHPSADDTHRTAGMFGGATNADPHPPSEGAVVDEEEAQANAEERNEQSRRRAGDPETFVFGEHARAPEGDTDNRAVAAADGSASRSENENDPLVELKMPLEPGDPTNVQLFQDWHLGRYQFRLTKGEAVMVPAWVRDYVMDYHEHGSQWSTLSVGPGRAP